MFHHFVIGGEYEINLDRRKLKTPGGKLFTVPNEALAIAVATEWDAQRDTLKFYTMHMVRPFTLGSYRSICVIYTETVSSNRIGNLEF